MLSWWFSSVPTDTRMETVKLGLPSRLLIINRELS